MKSTRLLAALAVGLMASMQGAASAVMQRAYPAALKAPKTDAPSATVGSSRNGGHKGGNRRMQRVAQKRRNVARNRLAHRG